MSLILYPVAATVEAAFSRPLGRAAREREAQRVAGEAVGFVTEAMGPAFATRQAALEAYGARVEDLRTGAGPEPQDRYCHLLEQAALSPGERLRLAKPANKDGRRWPAPLKAPATVWRLQVSYWRIATAARPAEAPQARKARRGGEAVDAETLRAIARQPLRPIRPQQPLDIGLFEVRPPEAPHIIMPDE